LKRATREIFKNVNLKRILLAFDFDGTLAPIQIKPESACIAKSLLPILKKLKRDGATIAVITGRSLKDVRKRLLFKPDYLVGNHGMEGLPEFGGLASRVRDLKTKWPNDPGIFLEDKKESLSLHYREAKNRKAAVKELKNLIAQLNPRPRVIPGKYLFNVIPRGSPHKGLALKQVMRTAKLSHAIFIGDDDTDEDAFRQKGKILSIRIGETHDSAAKFYIRRQTDMRKLLLWLDRSAFLNGD
jgi:trehalose 6-phosphate phosphatase